MPRARPGARKTDARRRIQRYRTKWTHHVIPGRIKRLLPHMTEEYKEEEPVFVECEEPTMAELEAKGVPKSEWPYYLGYMKRMLIFYRQYTGATLELEKTSLIAEYVLREKDRHVLEQVQEVAAECAGFPPVPPFTCEDVLACLEGDYSDWAIYDSFDGTVVDRLYGQYAVGNREESEILLVEGQTYQVRKYTISSKTLEALGATKYLLPGEYHGLEVESVANHTSVLGTYFVGMTQVAWAGDGVVVWKNGVLIKTFTYADLGFNTKKVYSVSISRSGKYIIVSGIRSATGNGGWVVLVGS